MPSPRGYEMLEQLLAANLFLIPLTMSSAGTAIPFVATR
jgi:hypothetical protein